MPRELPGFYYDEDKNRYFPINGPIPGSSRKRKLGGPGPQLLQGKEVQKSSTSCSKLLQSRELSGNIITHRKGRLNFQMEYSKKLASQPLIWKYQETEKKVVSAMENLSISVNMPTGMTNTNILLTGGVNGTIWYKYDEIKCESTGAQKHAAPPSPHFLNMQFLYVSFLPGGCWLDAESFRLHWVLLVTSFVLLFVGGLLENYIYNLA